MVQIQKSYRYNPWTGFRPEKIAGRVVLARDLRVKFMKVERKSSSLSSDGAVLNYAIC